MPAYEVAVIIQKVAQRAVLKSALQHTCGCIYTHGGVIKNMENLGLRELPQPMKAHKVKHYDGNYFAIQFESSVDSMKRIAEDYRNTKEIIHFGIIRDKEEPRRPCIDGPCLFGEIPRPDHEKTAYTHGVLKRLKYENVPNM